MYDFSDKGFVTVRFGNGFQDSSELGNYISDSDVLLNKIGEK